MSLPEGLYSPYILLKENCSINTTHTCMQNVLIHYLLGDSTSVGTPFITVISSPIY